jgi:predicted GTPase
MRRTVPEVDMRTERVLIMGAAGRDFHDFNVVYRDDPGVEVVAFTATQIPGIADRRYPTALAGDRYPAGIPIRPEAELETLIRDLGVDTVVFAYSDVSHEQVLHAASRAMAAGSDFELLGPKRTMLESTKPVVSVCAVRTGSGKSQTSRFVAKTLEARPRPLRDDDRGARGVRAAPRCRAPRVRPRGLRADPARR